MNSTDLIVMCIVVFLAVVIVFVLTTVAINWRYWTRATNTNKRLNGHNPRRDR